MKKIESFTGMRFIMIMVIVLAHFYFLSTFDKFGDFYKRFLNNPIFAVDFFFLLSGFGMMLSFLNRNDSSLEIPKFSYCMNYGIKHIKKIYPVYFATIILGICIKIITAVVNSEFNFDFIKHEVVKIIVNIPLLQSATGMLFFTHAYNPVSWFLSCLFLIYIVSPLLMYFLDKTSKSITYDIFLIIVNAVIILVLAHVFEKIELAFNNIKGLPDVNALHYSSPFHRVFYVLIGMNLAMIFVKLKNRNVVMPEKISNIFEVFISILVVIYFFIRNSLPDTNFYYKYLIDVFLCSCFVFVFAFDKGVISNIMKKSAIQFLGNISMYIFLIHFPLIMFLGALVEKYYSWTVFSATVFMCFILFSTFVISVIIYKTNITKGRKNNE